MTFIDWIKCSYTLMLVLRYLYVTVVEKKTKLNRWFAKKEKSFVFGNSANNRSRWEFFLIQLYLFSNEACLLRTNAQSSKVYANSFQLIRLMTLSVIKFKCKISRPCEEVFASPWFLFQSNIYLDILSCQHFPIAIKTQAWIWISPV